MIEQDKSQPNSSSLEPSMTEGTKALNRVFSGFLVVLTILAFGCLLFYLFSGLFILETGKVALVWRFGKLVKVCTQPGWYLTFPKYIDLHQKFRTEERRTFTLDAFWYKEDPKTVLTSPDKKTPPPDETSPLRVGEGGYLLTADQNIIHTKWMVIYKIADVKAFYFHYRDPEDVMKLVLREVILQVVSRLKIDQILHDREGLLNSEVRKRYLPIIHKIDMGVEILQVNLLERTVPKSTLKAFTAVTDAINEADRLIKDARGFANKEIETARGEARKIEEEALAYKQKVMDSAVADANYLQQIQQQFQKSGASIILPEYVKVLSDLMNRAEQIIVVYPNQELRLSIEPEPLGGIKSDSQKSKKENQSR